jgi:type IV pilus assembly protein PilA
MDTLKRNQSEVEAGFTLIELLIVMSVMLILMTLAVPQLLKLRKQANETSAEQSVRTIGNAELQYDQAYPSLGFACGLAPLGGSPGSAPSAQAAQVLDPALAAGFKAGYTFAVTACNKTSINNQDHINGYTITAVPSSVGRTGDRGFCMDENNILKFDPAGGTNCTQTLGQ